MGDWFGGKRVGAEILVVSERGEAEAHSRTDEDQRADDDIKEDEGGDGGEHPFEHDEDEAAEGDIDVGDGDGSGWLVHEFWFGWMVEEK